MTKAYTKEEAREEFIDNCKAVSHYWSTIENITEKERCNGVLHSILCIIDGCTMLPAYDIHLAPHPDDKEYLIKNGENYYEDGMVINDDVLLHEMLYMKALT
jgi:hypothetical protein